MSQPVIPIELEDVFEKIRFNNRFTITGGEVVWGSDWPDDEIQPFDGARVTWSDGVGYLKSVEDGLWLVVITEGESPFTAFGEDYTVAADDNNTVVASDFDVACDEIQFLYPFYDYGSIPEIVDRVNGEFGVDKNTAFPLAALVTIDNGYTPHETMHDWMNFDFRMYLCVRTEQGLTTKERYRQSYEGQLNPLWCVIRRYLEYDSYIIADESTDFRERWGKNGLYGREDNVFNEMVDALEIELTLTYNTYNYDRMCNASTTG